MADFLSSIRSFPPKGAVSGKEYDRLAKEFVREVGKISPQAWAKPIGKQHILDLLDPAVHSVTYLIALATHIQAAGPNFDRVRLDDAVTRSVVFFTSFDPVQVRYAGEYWRWLIDWAFDVYPKVGVQDFTPLTTALLRLDPSAGTFTSSHLLLVRLCIQFGVPSQALPILDRNIYAYPQHPPKNAPEDLPCDVRPDELSNAFINPASGLTIWPLHSEHVLEYYLLGAQVYLGLRLYSRARLFLEYVLLHPSHSHTCSALQVEAYKKFVLLGLLMQGKSFPLPRTHDQQVFKYARACSKAYEALAQSFERRAWRKFEAEVDVGAQIWTEDGNLRMVNECNAALVRYRIVDLQKTYAVLPVGRVARHLGYASDAMLKLLDDMIRQRHLSATISPSRTTDPGDAVLRFDTSPPPQDESAEDLEAQTKRIESLIAFIHDADRRLQLSKEYADYRKRSKRGMAGADGELAEQMDLTWDAPIANLGEDDDGDGDEDIMAA